MHELAIAEALVRTACERSKGRRVLRVGVRAGHLRQVVPTALSFSFELVARGTDAEGAALDLESVPVRVACRFCGAENEATCFPLRCATCSSTRVEVVAGEELSLEWIEVDDEAGHDERGEEHVAPRGVQSAPERPPERSEDRDAALAAAGSEREASAAERGGEPWGPGRFRPSQAPAAVPFPPADTPTDPSAEHASRLPRGDDPATSLKEPA